MSDGYIAVDEGSAKNIDHWTRNIGGTVYQARVVHAPDFAPTYAVVTAALNITSANEHLLEIMSGTTNQTTLRRLRVHQVAAANAAALVEFELYRIDSAGTGGTAITPEVADTADTAADSTAMAKATSKGTEDELLDYWNGVIESTLTNISKPIIDASWDQMYGKAPIAPAGASNGLALKCLDLDTAATFRVVAVVQELNWA